MNQADRKVLGTYIRDTADRMNLRDWTIVFADDPCDDHLAGNSNCVNGQRHIEISVAKTFRDHNAKEQRETIVHELVHAHQDMCWKMVQTDLAEPLGKIAYYIFCDAYRRSMEYCTDALAKTIAEQMPLIEWPRQKEKG